MNKDPKKSKYSDTLHRFCKKEHDWGWKKFMELSKVLDGFTVADTLVIKAQVQVIHEKPARPFRCLEPQYRRELVRVYLTNVEGICRRFLEERRDQLAKFQEDSDRWGDMREFLGTAQGKAQAQLASEKADVLLKGIVKRFFNEKEVTSTLVMDALCCGCQALDIGSTKAEDAFTAVEQLRHFPYSLFGEVAEAGYAPWCPAGYDVEKGFVVFGVVINECWVLAVFSKNQVSDAVKQGKVTSWCNW